MIVSLSILNADKEHLKEYFAPINFCPFIHMDIMDGKFVKETSFNEEVVERAYEANPRSVIDVHLMVDNPDPLIPIYEKAHADFLTFHYEVGDIARRIALIKTHNMKPGLSVNPDTDIKLIEPYLKDLSLVLVMSVWPGKGGQEFMMEAVHKLRYLMEYKKTHNLHYMISVDGGINLTNYQLVKPFTDIAVVGSAITKASDYAKAYTECFKLFL